VEKYKAVSSHKGYVLFVGRMVAQKGILTLLDAMKLTAPDARLLVVGQGELAGRIQDEIKSPELLARVSWLGPKWGDELTALIEDCAAVVIPSEWYDNLPVVLCMANAIGKPVIASRINGIPEYVSEGKNGFLFEPGNSAELGNLIDRVLGLSSSEYRTLALASRMFAEEVLDYSNHYQRLMLEFLKIKGEVDD
jgi:glycosyltransferase involved in cell wall biosynthesis